MVADVHARALAELAGEVEVRGVFARDPARRAAFAARHGLPAAASLEAMLADPGVEAILLLTPPDARLAIVEAAARAGKHVLAEKPLERSAAAAAEIVEICERAGVTLGVVFQHRMRAASRALADLARSGALGALATRAGRPALVAAAGLLRRARPRHLRPRRRRRPRHPGDPHPRPHALASPAPWPRSPPSPAPPACTAWRPRTSSAPASASPAARSARSSPPPPPSPAARSRSTLGFEEGSARLEGGTLTVTRRDGSSETVGAASGTGGGADPMAFPHDWHRDVIADFARAIRAGQPPAVPGRAALEVHRLIDALARSAREGRTVRL